MEKITFLRVSGFLVSCNVLWSFASFFGKDLLSAFTPDVVAWFRVAGAWASVEFLLLMRPCEKVSFRSLARSTQGGIALLGITTFALGPLCGYRGLAIRDAVDGALVVALEPLFAAFLGWILLGERWKHSFTGGWILSLLGLAILEMDRPLAGHLGLALLIAAVLFEGLSTALGKKLSLSAPPEKILVWALRLGTLLLTLFAWKGLWEAPWKELGSFPLLRALIFLGPIGTGAGYLFWIRETRKIPVALAVLTLFLQPVLGVVWGIWLRGEEFGAMKAFGALTILFGILWAIRSEKPFRTPLDR